MTSNRSPFLKKLIAGLNKNQTDDLSIKKAQDLIEELHRNEQQFVSYVTHQLMAPVSSIHKHSFSMMKDSKLNQSHRQQAALIHDYAVKLEDLLAAYLKTDRLKTKNIEVKLEPIDAAELINELIDQLEKDHSQRVSINIKKLPKIFADKEKLKELLTHILDNALRYSKGKINLEIKTGKGRHARDIIISIQDRGLGIAEKDKNQIFESFFRGSNHSHKGSGLGLYLSKAIAQKHNGEIWFESVENKGSIFYIAIPIAK